MSKDRKFTLTECFFCSHTPLSNTYILAAMEMKTHTHTAALNCKIIFILYVPRNNNNNNILPQKRKILSSPGIIFSLPPSHFLSIFFYFYVYIVLIIIMESDTKKLLSRFFFSLIPSQNNLTFLYMLRHAKITFQTLSKKLMLSNFLLEILLKIFIENFTFANIFLNLT